jgi:hypothetical protein
MHKVKQFLTTEPDLQKILKGILHTEKERNGRARETVSFTRGIDEHMRSRKEIYSTQ